MKPVLWLGVAVAGVLALTAGTIYQAAAADAPAMQADAGPGTGPDGGPGWGQPGGHGSLMHHRGGHGEHGGPGFWQHHDDTLGLFARSQNKDLSTADVKMIAQAILLEHGQHAWTVSDVTQSNGAIDFSYTTPHGDVVASFAVDPKTGHIKRVS